MHQFERIRETLVNVGLSKEKEREREKTIQEKKKKENGTVHTIVEISSSQWLYTSMKLVLSMFGCMQKHSLLSLVRSFARLRASTIVSKTMF